ncbi:MAG: hypothetical protein K9N21_03875 [Deltaproteobacteria bacterium]|nr:hypothetical protein [Deltaproteobacteria bacterium]
MGEKDALPWWLEGEETCPFCCQPYSYEMERRCVHCDGPICPWCCASDEPEICCPECSLLSEGDS